MLKFSIKNAFRKKSTAILASLGVAIGLMLVFVVGAYTAGVQAQFDDNLTRTLGIVTIIEESEVGPNSELPLDLPERLLNTEDVGDYIIDYTSGVLLFLGDEIVSDFSEIEVQYSSVERQGGDIFFSAQPNIGIGNNINIAPGVSVIEDENIFHISGKLQTGNCITEMAAF